MFPKKGQVWTYRERTRFLAFTWCLPIMGFVALGIYIGMTRANWLVLILSVVALGFLALYFFSNERKYRGEP
jgi:hypothetical protein